MLGGVRLRPKSAGGSRPSKFEYLPISVNNTHVRSVKISRLYAIIFVCFLFWFLRPLSWLPGFSRSSIRYPPAHPPGSRNLIHSASPYIYPPIEDATVLKKLDVDELVYEDGQEKMKQFHSLNFFDDADANKQKLKEKKENAASEIARAKNNFKNQVKRVYWPKSNKKKSPKIVIVTALDFHRYSTESLAKIAQNRVDYAHKHGYGLYVRWVHEFIPEFNSKSYLDSKEGIKWARLFCLRGAMFAFPDADWMWYIDQNGLITNLKVDIHSYLLEPDALKAASLNERSVIPPNGLIRTYKNLPPQNIKFIFTQSETQIDTSSFIVRNDDVGRALIDTLCSKLYLDYNFPNGPDSAVAHILQWHPFILSKTTIVSARTINSFYDEDASLDKATDHMHYFVGDLIAQWSHCSSNTECELMLQKVAGGNEEIKN